MVEWSRRGLFGMWVTWVVRSRLAAAAASAMAAAMARLRRSPWMNPAGWETRAPNRAMASAPPSWRLVLNTPLTVPASGVGDAVQQH